jgi:membrane-associated phospholipid phosphatase
MQFVQQVDEYLLRLINVEWRNTFFSGLMPFLRNTEIWAPLYLLLVLMVVFNSNKNIAGWLLCAIATVAFTDVVTAQVLKENVPRLRPCNDAQVLQWLQLIPGLRTPGSFSFASSHAANHFGLAMYCAITMHGLLRGWRWLLFAWAAAICYAQLYIGVHYPSDIVAGAIIGCTTGYGLARLQGKYWPLGWKN